MKRVAVIVAGGAGTRMGKELPKQFLTLQGKAVLLHSITAFLEAYPAIPIIVVLPKAYLTYTEDLIKKAGLSAAIQLVEGGATRFDSVKNGLKSIDEADLIFVHDAVRCLVSPQLIQTCSNEAQQHGSAIPVISVRDSMRRVNPIEHSSSIIDRENLVIVQTPQTFKSSLLLPAFDVDYSAQFTDEASVVEAAGHQVHLVQGEETNIKITFPEDLVYAEWRLGDKG